MKEPRKASPRGEPEIDPAVEAAAEIECLVFDGERNVNDWERIIRSACEKATEQLQIDLDDMKRLYQDSYLYNKPAQESRAASVPRGESCFISGESSRICERGTKSCEIEHKKGGEANAISVEHTGSSTVAAPTVQPAGAAENWTPEGVKESVANMQVARWRRREKAAQDAQLPKKRFIGPY